MTKKYLKVLFIAAVLVVGIRPAAFAGPIAPNCPGGLHALPAATFGGSGIPNTFVCTGAFSFGGDTVTLGLTATQRFANPAPTNDGLGTFTAQGGGDTLDSAPNLAMWQFDYYASVTGTGTYNFTLGYDFDPGANTDVAAMGKLSMQSTGTATGQNSLNLGFAFLGAAGPGVTPPSFPGFNPSSGGEYSFYLLFQQTSLITTVGFSGSVSMNVDVTAPVPEPGSMILLGSGLIGLLAAARRRRNK